MMSIILSILGWAAAGVRAGSIAAGLHSLIGNVISGSWFAILQSLGATGAGLPALLARMLG
ncbi:hypothetical protein B0T09DRAFT_337871 [Sordaria sp. MPI-SDFR-AT-0083]|nr:hypothetical protein B0T09DRAFT_337871 [Sordaria sp. MPI-SDFR-AT-0083]